MAKYRGRERTLYLGICEKYRLPPTFELQRTAPGAPPPGAAAPPPPADGKKTKKFRELITEIYKEHNPSKLADVDNLLMKYRGREELVYKGICEKYNVEPKLPGKEDAKMTVEKYKQLIGDIYAEHNKEKLGELDELLGKYKGKEKTLYLAVCHKYNIEPKLPGAKKKEKKGETEEARAEKLAKLKPLIVEVYQEHNPSKVDSVDQLLAKYKGKEEQLYHSICEKYSVEPKVPKPDTGAAAPDGGKDKDGEGKEEQKSDAPEAPKAEPAKSTALLPARGKGPAALRQAFGDLIREVYKVHNPSKLSTMDHLLEKYLGQEQDLYLTICRKYGVQPQDPEGLGDLDWMLKAQERLPHLLRTLMHTLVLHTTGFDEQDAQRLQAWEEVRPKDPPASLSYRYELQGLSASQISKVALSLHGADGSRWTKLVGKCKDAEIKGPPSKGGHEADSSPDALIVAGDSGSAKGKKPFDSAVVHVTDALGRSVRAVMDAMGSDDEGQKENWHLPWSCEENAYILTPSGKKEVGVEYRRGCWNPRRYVPMHSQSAHHSLCGPDVEGRLPEFWRELADKIWLGVLTLSWGSDVPLETVVTIQTSGGHEAAGPSEGFAGCAAAPPSASVIVTAPSQEELDKANRKISPLLSKVLTGMRANAAFAMHLLAMPQFRPTGRNAPLQQGMVLAARTGVEDRDGTVSSDSDEDPVDAGDYDDEVMSDMEPTETHRPFRLTRAQIRDAYLQGLLCLNCDASDHKHQDCPFKKKVCWNCHGNHAGNDCPHRCRFSRERNNHPILESVKKICRRVTEWKKSKSAQEQRNVLALLEQLEIKLAGFADIDLAKHNKEVQDLVKSLNEQTTLFPVEFQEVALSILDMKPPTRQPVEPAVPPPPAGAPPKPYVAPKLPKDPPPPMPENKYPWQEKIFLDTLLPKGMYGSNILSRVIGRGGMHHRRMESESGARVFFRGLGVSGRDMELTDPTDCRLHISVKGEVPQQGKSVRRIMKEIIAELDNELTERGENGPALDNPRMPETHPFGFMLPKGAGPESGEPLKFRFPEEDGQTLNDVLVWLKQAKLPLELDSDTQWRTTLQVTPAEPPPPDDAPEEAEVVCKAFNKMLSDWSHPSPYWFEEFDLRPTGLWSSLTAQEAGEGPGNIALQQNQGVQLSAGAVDHFSTLLERTQLSSVPKNVIREVLSRLRGVVRRQVEDDQLLLYLQYPWAWFSEAMGRGLKLPYSRNQVHTMLAEMGRVGGKPTESQVSPPFRGFSVEWLPLKAGSAPTMPTQPAAVSQLPEVPTTIPHIPTDQAGAPPITPTPALPATSAAPRGFCKYWLPEAAFASRQDLKELIAGPGGSHFAHVLRKYPSVDLRIDGQCSASVPPAHRMHVCMSSEDSEVFESASTDVLDLVETVCDMVGEELGMSEDEVEKLISEIRAEKYFEAHGIRTPLPPTRAAQAPAATPATAAPTADAADFEFVDDDLELEEADDDDDADADTEDEDAKTEASDLMSDVTEAEDEPKTVFDDI